MTVPAIPAGSLILVRHGQTASNIVHRLDSRPPGAPLTELGHQQAQTLAQTLGGVEFAAVVSSVAVRAQQTAAPLAAAVGTQVQVLDGLQETDAGVLEDREDREAHLEFVRVYGAWHAGELDARIAEGESGREVLARFVPVVQQLRQRHLQQGAGSVVLVSHGAAIRLVAAQLAGVDGDFAATYSLPNTAMVVLQPTAEGWRCLQWDQHTPPFRAPDTPHVEGPA
jgi:broad specificity phosphatase PhoE